MRRPPSTSSASLRVGDIVIDLRGHIVSRDGVPISLTPLEFELLHTLASSPTEVFSREALLEQVWGYQYKADTRLVNVHVQRLRSKVERDVDEPKIVQTVRGVGYRAGEIIPT
jgi:two-component system response regulator MtrA